MIAVWYCTHPDFAETKLAFELTPFAITGGSGWLPLAVIVPGDTVVAPGSADILAFRDTPRFKLPRSSGLPTAAIPPLKDGADDEPSPCRSGEDERRSGDAAPTLITMVQQ